MPALIIFVKNPILGKVKTRLAAAVGDLKALEIYKKLVLDLNRNIESLSIDKYIFYSDFIDIEDIWGIKIYHKRLQDSTTDLGQRMLSAINLVMEEGHQEVILIGSDIVGINTELLKSAFENLNKNDVIIGPTYDGGYYGIGFNFENLNIRTKVNDIFLGKTWSHENVFSEAKESIIKLGLRLFELDKLHDIDTESDLKYLNS